MVLRLTKQRTICKNLKKMVVFDIDWQTFQLKNYLTKIKLLKIKKYKQRYFYFSLS
jgi:hypothetical protein